MFAHFGARRGRGLAAVSGLAIVSLWICPLYQINLQTQLPEAPIYQKRDVVDFTLPEERQLVDESHNASIGVNRLYPRAESDLPFLVTLSVSAAKCNGDAAIAMMNGPGMNRDANTAPKDLVGWSEVVPPDSLHSELKEPLQALYPASNSLYVSMQYMEARQDKSYQDSNGMTRHPTGGYYSQIINPKDGFIIAVNNVSPRNLLIRAGSNPAQVQDELPTVSYWSDLAWSQWLEACRKDKNRSSKGLMYIIRDNVSTRNTKYIMGQVVDPSVAFNELSLPWPGKDFAAQSNGGRALLGTSHGQGIARMLSDHRRDIPGKKVQRITVWTVNDKYYLLFALSRS